MPQEPFAAPDTDPLGSYRLLADDEPPAVRTDRPDGMSPLFLACDHAGRLVPRRLGRLGLPEAAFERHIAWDIGIEAVSLRVSQALDATVVRQTYSRLVIDCNRPGGVASSIPVVSEDTAIPGNVGITAAEAEARRREIFVPYHDRLRAELDRRGAAGRASVLVAMHSFTPVYLGVARPWHIGTLYGGDARLATILRDLLREEDGLVVGDNEPYSVSAATDYTIPVHGEGRGLPHVGIEIRQDLIATEAGQTEWAERMSRILPQAAARFT